MSEEIENIKEDSKDYSFQALSGVRESLSIAKRQPGQIAYESALDIIEEINPEAYKKIVTDLERRNKSDEVRYYIEKAEALSTDENNVNPVDLIDKDLSDIEKALETGRVKGDSLKRKKYLLIAAKDYFKPREVSEHKILNHDFYLRTQKLPECLEIYKDEKFVDYQLSNDRYLRLRLLHPDNEEIILGSDLIYEQYDLEKEMVRFVHIQYKLWGKEGLYFSQGNILQQIDKVHSHLCNLGFCNSIIEGKNDENYRFPFCSGFLRPTDKQLDNDKDMKSTGLHIPICYVKKVISNGQKKLTRQEAKNKGLSHNVFDELFVNEFVGSRWISISELEKFYIDKGIESSINMIRVHAQEIYLKSENQRVLKKGL